MSSPYNNQMHKNVRIPNTNFCTEEQRTPSITTRLLDQNKNKKTSALFLQTQSWNALIRIYVGPAKNAILLAEHYCICTSWWLHVCTCLNLINLCFVIDRHCNWCCKSKKSIPLLQTFLTRQLTTENHVWKARLVFVCILVILVYNTRVKFAHLRP